MNKKIRICFTGRSSSFINSDYEILKKHFDVIKFEPPNGHFGLLKYIISLAKGVKECNLTFSWFADWYSAFTVFFSKLLKKKSIVVVGGYDAAYFPEIKYGAFANIKEKLPAKYVLKNADLLLAVSEFTKKSVLEKIIPKKIEVIYNGVDVDKFKPQNKEKIVVTIGGGTERSYKLKGIETFAKVSTSFPDYKFIIIGPTENHIVEKLKKINPKLIFTGIISHDEVLKLLQKVKIYCQLSYIESFGMGAAEAMSCGCIPVVTKRGGLPEIVGENGFYISYDDEKETVAAIEKALNVSDKTRKNVINQIKNNFSLELREKRLVKSIKMQIGES